MAQMHGSASSGKLGRLARRVGVTGSTGAVIACLVLACVLGVGYVVRVAVVGPGVEIQRDEGRGEATAEEEGVAGDTAASGDADEGSASTAAPAPSSVVVHVDGAVAAPGVYHLMVDGPRVADAVEAAGGLASDADTTTVNLAALVEDGSKVYIPREGEDASSMVSHTGSVEDASTATSPSSGLVNINTAGSAELQTLSGIGEATAAAIIEDREANGPFASIEDIMRVSGIGEGKFAKIRDGICV